MQNTQNPNPLTPVNSPYSTQNFNIDNKSSGMRQMGQQKSPPMTNQYTLSSVQQLFELNPQNYENFQSNFSVKSLTNEPFWGLVVDQTTLDSGSQLEFKSADVGFFSGEIVQDTDNNSNWYLVLKSIKPNNVIVDIQTQPIYPKQNQTDNSRENYEQQPAPTILTTQKNTSTQNDSSINWMNILLYVLVTGIVLVILYFVMKKYFWKQKTVDKSIDPSIQNLIPTPEIKPMIASSKLKSPGLIKSPIKFLNSSEPVCLPEMKSPKIFMNSEPSVLNPKLVSKEPSPLLSGLPESVLQTLANLNI